ncbi:FAD/NAD(P)-binding domain-containing protein [Apiospora phragmitis]|uniref:FAD/NAD(P)-binding domain-containing protein n=1 Tax=Apiospora phragmitis TaxID=2905665 RepID=A0ABR1UGP5_9PEZI
MAASSTEISDAIIVGGSHAGLAAALTLYRASHTSLVFDAGAPRNALSDHVYMVPAWDGKNPNDLREASRAELLRTGLVQVVERRLVSASKLEDGTFEVVDAEGEHWKGRKIILASGVEEKHPDIPRYTENYGKLIYHCLFCFGYEKRGSDVAAVLATDPLGNPFHAPVFAADAFRFVKHVKLYTHGDAKLADDLSKVVAEKQLKDIDVDNRKVVRVSKTEDNKLRVEFDTGADDVVGFMGHSPDSPVNPALPNQLGCEIDPKTGIKVTQPWYATTAPGVFAAGDCCSPLRSVLTGMSAGSCAGVDVARHLAGFSF